MYTLTLLQNKKVKYLKRKKSLQNNFLLMYLLIINN